MVGLTASIILQVPPLGPGLRHEDRAEERRAFYTLASYYQRTRRIVRSALTDHREPLAQAALRNLVALHRPLMHMHGAASSAVPLAMVLERDDRDEIVRDLVMRALTESPEPMSDMQVLARVNELDVMGGVQLGTVQRHLEDLAASGHVVRLAEGHKCTNRTYSELDVDAASLRALVGPQLYAALAGSGIHGLHDAEARAALLRERLAEADLCSETCAALLEAVATLQDARLPGPTGWRQADLLNSPYPRPYQYEAYAVFRAGGYQGELVEAPTGSGKTMVGMLCIEDWLRTVRPGQSILVLVPTSNYQQQWINELCFTLSDACTTGACVSGTPGNLERFRRRTGSHPAIIVTTYTALAQTGSVVSSDFPAPPRPINRVSASWACTWRTAFRWTRSSVTATSHHLPSWGCPSRAPPASDASEICWTPIRRICWTMFAGWGRNGYATGSPGFRSMSELPSDAPCWACTGSAGCSRGNGETDARVGEARRYWTHRRRARQHNPARSRLV